MYRPVKKDEKERDDVDIKWSGDLRGEAVHFEIRIFVRSPHIQR